MKIVIFSGTTEGRRLSEMLCRSGIEHHVCVATKYGNDVMTKSEKAHVHIGRMDSDGMREYLEANGIKEGDTVVDATHPYAAEVSQNIEKTVKELGCVLIRVGRDPGGVGEDRNGESDNIRNSYVNKYKTVEDFAHVADHLNGNILLTTGSKELMKYCSEVSKDTLLRSFVRILPSPESIDICENCGINPSNIIAMKGPFSYDMNRALMRDLDIRHLFTKDSGHTGGFEEKVRAADDLSVSVHILTRPGADGRDPGISITEAFEKITGSRYHPKRKISLVGIGPGAGSVMTIEAAEAVRSAEAVFGARRMLDSARLAGLLGHCTEHAMYRAGEIAEYLDEQVDITNIAVLFSGDTGFYSGAKEVYSDLSKWDPEAEITVIPGISSVSYLASKCHESYDDAAIVSVHGRNSLHNMEMLLDTVRANRKTFALMSSDEDVRTICRMLEDKAVPVTVRIARNLSYGDSEEIVDLDAKGGAEYTGEGLITVLFIKDE